MKKLSYLIPLLMLISINLLSCGGGGGTGIDLPGVGTPDKIALKGSSYIAQTGGSITLEAHVTYKGRDVQGVEVTFINLSPIGRFLNSATTKAITASSTNKATTDSYGKARINISSTTFGFATVRAEINGADYVRDEKLFYFTTAIVIYPSLSASIDGDGDGSYGDSDDFILIANGRDTATIKATLLDARSLLISDRSISFSTDTTFIDCTLEDCTTLDQPYAQEIVFPNGRTARTNDGEATVEIIASSNIKEFRTSFNVSAVDTTSGAFDLFTVFLDPVTVGTVTVTAAPPVVAPSGTSVVTICAYTTGDSFNTGVPVPDGTIITVSATAGVIAPFVQTIGGCATTTFTAPLAEGGVTITATVGGMSGFTIVTVTTTLTVVPSPQTIDGVTGGTATFTIFGGIPPYSIFSSDSLFPPVPPTVAASGLSFTVTVPAATPATTVTYTIMDATGATVTATLVITGPTALAVTPSATLNLACGGSVLTYTVTGGVPPYTVVSGNPLIIIGGSPVATDGGQFTATSAACAGGVGDTDVDIVVSDSDGPPSTVTVTITENDP